jgi:hypothetical protein
MSAMTCDVGVAGDSLIRALSRHFAATVFRSARFCAHLRRSLAFPITAIPGSPENPVLVFWGGIPRDSGDLSGAPLWQYLFLISVISANLW